MHRVREILNRQTESFYVKPEWTVCEAARYMAKRNIGAAAVIDDDRRVIGMFSERDIIQRVVAAGRDPSNVTVREIMTTDIVTTTPEETLDICAAKMNARRCRHLPVLDQGRLTGMISMRDILEMQLRDIEQENEHLRAYLNLVPPGFQS